jgi:hypothetical protein
MINRGIMKALLKETGKTPQRIYQMIKDKKKEYNYTIPKEMAAYLVAAEIGIDISKILPEEELAKLRDLKETKMVVREKRGVIEKPPAEITIDVVREFQVVDPFLPKKLINDAVQMAKIYPILYLFENSVRNLIQIVLQQKYGSNWWDSKVPNGVKQDVEKRLLKEEANRWHGKRGAHKIFYTNIGDLNSIISTNWDDFKDIFPNQAWIKSRIDEIELSRNIIAHNNPLSDRDIKRLKLYFGDWVKQIKECKAIKKMSEEIA